MSELYLVLRRRLDEVTDWVTLGADTMRAARHARGLSVESVARLIYVSSRTYERWEKRGQVPRVQLAKVAEVLNLEIEQPARQRVTVSPPDANAILGEIRQVLVALQDGQRSLQERVERIEGAVDQLGQRGALTNVP